MCRSTEIEDVSEDPRATDNDGPRKEWGLLTVPALERPDLVAPAVFAALRAWQAPTLLADVRVAEIDPSLADTAECCAAYDIPMDVSANCVVIAGRRSGSTSYVACNVLATTRADVNGIVRRWLGARKASFASQDDVVAATGMEYGGITPIGRPAEWSTLVDAEIMGLPRVVIGSGLRGSKIVLPGRTLVELPGAEKLAGLGKPVVTSGT